jgi:hypothetical protein
LTGLVNSAKRAHRQRGGQSLSADVANDPVTSGVQIFSAGMPGPLLLRDGERSGFSSSSSLLIQL